MWADVTLFRSLSRGESAVEDTQRWVLPAGDVPLFARHARLDAAAEVVARLYGDGGAVRATVQADLHLVQPCDRCLAEVRLPVRIRYEEDWILHGPEPRNEDPAVFCAAVQGNGVDLDDGFWQNVELTMPAKVLCRKECLGLCPHCGADRNVVPCQCEREGSDPRLAPLADLFRGIR